MIVIENWMEQVDVWWKGDVGFDWFRGEILLLQGLQVLDDWAFEIVWNFYSWNVCVWRMSIGIEEMLQFIRIESQSFK